jgi:hypothetical protein
VATPIHDDPVPGEPPGGGRQDHDAMRAASIRPLSGPASSDDLAAIGGLEVPGHETHPELVLPTSDGVPEPIPGERDATTLTHREVGAVGGQFSGGDTPSPDRGTWLDAATARERVREGGGS